MENNNTVSDRTFGVEMEIVGLSRLAVFNLLKNAKFDVSFEEEESDSDDYCEDCDDYGCGCFDCDDVNIFSSWTVKSDCSIYAYERLYSCELVSPILRGERGLKQVKKVCAILENAGAGVNHTCGLHVHVGAEDLGTPEVGQIISRYARWETQIDKLFHPSRRGVGNGYANQMEGRMAVLEAHDNWESWSRKRLVNLLYDRFYKVNVQSLEKYGTVEFRQHNGAFRPNTVATWVQWCLAFVERSKQLAALPVAERRHEDHGPFDGFSDEIVEWCLERFELETKENSSNYELWA